MNAIECYPKATIFPETLDFEISRSGKLMEKKTLNRREDEEQMNLLNQLGASKFSESETEVYMMLSMIEKHVGWDALLEYRDQLFVKGQNNDWDNPKVAAECPKDDDKLQSENQDSISYVIIRQKGASNFYE